jgi:hypothetical protein
MAETPNTAREVHVYVGTGGHSAWFSDDSGETWVHPNSHSGMYLEARVWSIASHPATPERLFAGTDMGVFRWDEPTARWAHLPSPMQDVWAVAVDPANPDVVIAGTRPAGFFRSVDAGRSWTFREAVFDGQVATLDEAGIGQNLPHDNCEMCIRCGKRRMEIPDHRHCRLLSARGQRPRRR